MFCPRLRSSSLTLYIIGVLTGVIASYFMMESKSRDTSQEFPSRSRPAKRYDVPIVFIGGHPRSGTTLMRVLLDAHPSFHCGQETHIIPDLLALQRKYSRRRSVNRLHEAGLSLELINTTIAESVLNIIESRGDSKRLCNKDPFTLKHVSFLARMFPNAQFILMVRDARAVIHSIRTNKIRISRFPKTESKALRRWNKILAIMFQDCWRVGHERCRVVHYESLVLKPRFVLREILRFLRTPWSENVMNHTGYLDRDGGILLSRYVSTSYTIPRIHNIEFKRCPLEIAMTK
jgi:protein-tyrosine sulfotransferase